MATVINSSTTGLIVTPDNSGQLTLSANGVTALTANTAGNINFVKQPTIGGVEWPAFSVYKTAAQSVSGTVWTKVTFDVEEFDTNNNFASSRFTPTVAGYYQINGQVSNGVNTQTTSSIYKNGSIYKAGTNYSSGYAALISAIVYLNGSTDYVELYAYFGTTADTGFGNVSTWFNGLMIRGA